MQISPLSTLESSFEALNVKKFDGDSISQLFPCEIPHSNYRYLWHFFVFSVAFAVDPLYHQTSAQFDEGGARGLLLNNLGIYGDCQVLFDSQEIPGKANSCAHQHNKSEIIDLSFSKGLFALFALLNYYLLFSIRMSWNKLLAKYSSWPVPKL